MEDSESPARCPVNLWKFSSASWTRAPQAEAISAQEPALQWLKHATVAADHLSLGFASCSCPFLIKSLHVDLEMHPVRA